MDTNESKNNKLSKLVIYILFSVSIILSICTSFWFHKSFIISNEARIIKNKLEENKLIHINIINEKNLMTEKVIKYENIDNDIKDLKNKYFENVKVLEGKVLDGTVNKKIAYLTFDDGPYDLTDSLLEILNNYDIQATFFVLGKPQYESTYKKIKDSNHTIANHTYSHRIFNGLYNSPQSFIKDVLKLENFLNSYDIKTQIVRFPGGSPQAKNMKNSIIEELRKNGYGYVDWNVENGDGMGVVTIQSSYNKVIDQIQNKRIAVVLMHDYSLPSIESLPSIIEKLKNDGYIFLPLFKESIMVHK